MRKLYIAVMAMVFVFSLNLTFAQAFEKGEVKEVPKVSPVLAPTSSAAISTNLSDKDIEKISSKVFEKIAGKKGPLAIFISKFEKAFGDEGLLVKMFGNLFGTTKKNDDGEEEKVPGDVDVLKAGMEKLNGNGDKYGSVDVLQKTVDVIVDHNDLKKGLLPEALTAVKAVKVDTAAIRQSQGLSGWQIVGIIFAGIAAICSGLVVLGWKKS